MIFGPDGTTYIATREYVPDPADPGIYRITDYITVISSAGTVTDIQLVGIAAEGALLRRARRVGVQDHRYRGPRQPHHLRDHRQCHRNRDNHHHRRIGRRHGAVRPDGTVYQTTSDPNSGTTYVTTISTDGTTTTVAINH